MTPGDFILRLLFLAQTGIGVVGNIFLLSAYAPTSCAGHARRPTHLILSHMATANFLVLLFKGIPHMMFIWGVTPTLGNGGCKLLHYVPRVARGLSLCTTCLLSHFQAITISSRAGGRVGSKDRVWKNVNFSCVLCWVFNLLINVFIPIRVGSLPHNRSSPTVLDYVLCSFEKSDTSVPTGALFLTFPDVVFLGLMARASVHMVLLLYRHHLRVRHIYTHSNSHGFSPEAKATRTILLTAGTFLFVYSINSFLVLYKNVFFKSCLWLQHMTAFVVTFYPTVSPLLVLGNHRAPNCCSEMPRK
ncbi:Vomeronasal type-1 receptor 1 [Fukomys damarensis]|uniref:Vomeronasal type-1 receptor n=2 Tax=Fukomys damarensis TaxID=885580 RepID=A0A091E1T1_FUKDA|nr:Vomeronasal type-1 receptor 1 [Fukomys damarensis]